MVILRGQILALVALVVHTMPYQIFQVDQPTLGSIKLLYAL